MKKIGIISMQRVINYGSFLQAYALKKTIERVVKNCECEFIDLPTFEGWTKKKISFVLLLKLLRHTILNHKVVTDDINASIKNQRFCNVYYQECIRYLGMKMDSNHKTDYEKVVIGSDEVFNCTQEEVPWFGSMFLFGEEIQAGRLISYAGSFGYTTLDRLETFGLTEQVAQNLARFTALSVRDSNSAGIIESLIAKTPYMHLDPALIYDFLGEISIPSERNYLLVYHYPGRIKEPQIIKEVTSFAKKNGLTIISIFGFCEWADENPVPKPFEVLGYFKQANYVVTDTFHGCVLSIKYNRPFLAICRESNSNKMENLLSTFRLTNRMLSVSDQVEAVLHQSVDWETVNGIIEVGREEAICYLRENL